MYVFAQKELLFTKYGDDESFNSAVIANLNRNKDMVSPNYQFYYKMKEIYQSLLSY